MGNKQEEMHRLLEKYPGYPPLVLLKLSLVRYGAVLTARAEEEISRQGLSYKPDYSFGLSYGSREEPKVMPGPFLLRDASFVYINYGEDYEDPYTIDWSDERQTFILLEGEEPVVIHREAINPRSRASTDVFSDNPSQNQAGEEVYFIKPPAFYNQKTTSGRPMSGLVDIREQKLIMTSYRQCTFWRGGRQCKFCAFFTGDKSDLELDACDARDVVKAALEEPGRFSEFYLSGGTDESGEEPFGNEVDRYIRIFRAVGSNFREEDARLTISDQSASATAPNTRPVNYPSQLMAPAYPREQLERIYRETGVTSYSADIEIADPSIFAAYCPGKKATVGYEEWIKRLEEAVPVFGRGNVYTQVVAGAELAKPPAKRTRDKSSGDQVETSESNSAQESAQIYFTDENEAVASNLALADRLGQAGVTFLTSIWRPNRGALLGMQEMPSLEYYVRLSQGVADIHKKYNLLAVDDDYKHCGNHPDADLDRSAFGTEEVREIAAAKIKSISNNIIAAAIRRERTPEGSELIRALWDGKKRTFLIADVSHAVQVIGVVKRCLIGGDDFRRILEEVRAEDLRDDIAAVYLIETEQVQTLEATEEAAAKLISQAAAQPHLGALPDDWKEAHLDNMMFH